MAAALLAHWAMRWLEQPLVASALVALGAAAVVFALGRRRTAPADAELIWSGQAWVLAVAGQVEPIEVQQVRVMIDAGRWLLLQLVGPAVPRSLRWQCVGRGQDPGFRDLCTALYAQRSSSRLPLPPEPR